VTETTGVVPARPGFAHRARIGRRRARKRSDRRRGGGAGRAVVRCPGVCDRGCVCPGR